MSVLAARGVCVDNCFAAYGRGYADARVNVHLGGAAWWENKRDSVLGLSHHSFPVVWYSRTVVQRDYARIVGLEGEHPAWPWSVAGGPSEPIPGGCWVATWNGRVLRRAYFERCYGG